MELFRLHLKPSTSAKEADELYLMKMDRKLNLYRKTPSIFLRGLNTPLKGTLSI